ncbi:hypothetical protein BDA99DRAFT_555826 [Phascolomyces articulosus]|uniref:Uncharacterized protein n=1 Tax=Phascolomyces articulosus TaxID=60185 RepID=A0AAD5PJQ9_9FUNG|nr:hypothetical protein BDA99DRAFT_555826 [Phascolomyces articulosus]
MSSETHTTTTDNSNTRSNIGDSWQIILQDNADAFDRVRFEDPYDRFHDFALSHTKNTPNYLQATTNNCYNKHSNDLEVHGSIILIECPGLVYFTYYRVEWLPSGPEHNGINFGKFVNQRTSKTTGNMALPRQLGTHQYRIGLWPALRIYRTFIPPVLEYDGQAITTLYATQKDKIDNAQKGCIKMTLNRNAATHFLAIVPMVPADLPSMHTRTSSNIKRSISPSNIKLKNGINNPPEDPLEQAISQKRNEECGHPAANREHFTNCPLMEEVLDELKATFAGINCWIVLIRRALREIDRLSHSEEDYEEDEPEPEEIPLPSQVTSNSIQEGN